MSRLGKTGGHPHQALESEERCRHGTSHRGGGKGTDPTSRWVTGARERVPKGNIGWGCPLTRKGPKGMYIKKVNEEETSFGILRGRETEGKGLQEKIQGQKKS